MKVNQPFLKISLVGLFLITTLGASAQILPEAIPALPTTIAHYENLHVGTYDDGKAPINESMGGAVLFYRLNGSTSETSITLQASTHDAANVPFDLYAWYRITAADGSETGAIDQIETGRELTIDALEPGFYRYRVYGISTSGTTNCDSEEFQDIVFFVLNTLDPTAVVPTDAITEYCITATPTDNIELNTTVAFESAYETGNHLPTPSVDAFELTYRYYAVKDDQVSSPIELGTVTEAGADNIFEVDYSILNTEGTGTYTFFVDVTYSSAIKDRGGRAHAIWTEQIQRNGSNYTVNVTSQPGRPTIEIISSVD